MVCFGKEYNLENYECKSCKVRNSCKLKFDSTFFNELIIFKLKFFKKLSTKDLFELCKSENYLPSKRTFVRLLNKLESKGYIDCKREYVINSNYICVWNLKVSANSLVIDN